MSAAAEATQRAEDANRIFNLLPNDVPLSDGIAAAQLQATLAVAAELRALREHLEYQAEVRS